MELKYLLFFVTILSLSKYLRGDRYCVRKFTFTGKEHNKAITIGMTGESIKCVNQCVTSSLDIFNGGNSLKVEYRDCLYKKTLENIGEKLKCGMKIDLTKELREANVIDELPTNKKNTVQQFSLGGELNKIGIELSQDEQKKIQDLFKEGLNKKVDFDSLFSKKNGGGSFSVNCCDKDYCNLSVKTIHSIGLIMPAIFLSLFLMIR